MQIRWLNVSAIIRLLPADAEVLTLPDNTLRYIYALLWMLSYNSSSELREIYRNIYFFTDSVVCLSLSPRHGASLRWGWRNGQQTWWVVVTILNKQSGTEVNWWPSSFVFGRGVNKFSHKNLQCYEILRNGVLRALVIAVMDIKFSKVWSFIDYLLTCWFVRNVSSPWG